MTRPMALVAGLLVLGLGAWVALVSGLFGESEPPSPAALEAKLEEDKAARERGEAIAVAKAEQQRAVDLGTRATQLLEQAIAEAKRWEAEVAPLLTSDEGKRIAANDQRVETFLLVYSEQRPASTELEAAKVRVSSLVSQPREALPDSQSSYRPGADLLASLQTEKDAAEAALRLYQSGRERVQGMLLAARSEGAEPHGETLQAAIETLRARRAAADAEAERQREVRRLAEMQAVRDREAENALSQEKQELARAEAQKRDLSLQEEALARLREQAANPAVQSTFDVFVAKGYWQPGSNGERTPAPQPVSYSALVQSGVTKSYTTFVSVVTGRHRWGRNDRPTWEATTTRTKERYREEFDLFQQLAPIWAETGVLAP